MPLYTCVDARQIARSVLQFLGVHDGIPRGVNACATRAYGQPGLSAKRSVVSCPEGILSISCCIVHGLEWPCWKKPDHCPLASALTCGRHRRCSTETRRSTAEHQNSPHRTGHWNQCNFHLLVTDTTVIPLLKEGCLN